MVERPWDIRERLRQERTQAGLSQAQLAAATGLSKTYIVRLETDSSANPSLEVLGRLAEALDMTIADLIGTPRLQFELNEAAIPVSLKRYAAEVQLPRTELRTLASIRWRRGEEPQTSKRWDYIRQQLRISKTVEDEDA